MDRLAWSRLLRYLVDKVFEDHPERIWLECRIHTLHINVLKAWLEDRWVIEWQGENILPRDAVLKPIRNSPIWSWERKKHIRVIAWPNELSLRHYHPRRPHSSCSPDKHLELSLVSLASSRRQRRDRLRLPSLVLVVELGSHCHYCSRLTLLCLRWACTISVVRQVLLRMSAMLTRRARYGLV